MARNSPYRPLPDGTMKDLKDTADLSRNLVAAEYGTVEPPNKNGRIFEPPTKKCGVCTVAALRGAIPILLGIVVLLSLTGWREVQMWRMKRDVEENRRGVEELRSIVEGLRLNVNKLIEERSMLTDLNAYEDDGVFADLDGSEVVEDSFAMPETRFHKSEKTKDIPRMHVKIDNDEILPDDDEDDDDDDEEMYDEDGEDETSGMYGDYQRRTDGRTMADEYLGKVVSMVPNNAQYKRPSEIDELRRILHQDNILLKDKEERKPVANLAPNGDRKKRSVSLEPPPEESVDEFAAPRFRHYKPDHRRVHKKFLAEDPELIAPVEHVEAHRRTRESDDEIAGDRRVFVAAHFHGNTSHLNTETHPHYKGNGLLRVAHDAHHNVWSPAQWARAPHAPVLTRRGHVRVRKTGIYFVYVQIYYLDAHDISGWVLHRAAEDGDEREPLLQCAATSPSEQPRDKPNSCYSAAALLLREGDRLAVRNTGGDRHSLMQPEKSFIGLIKLADAEDQQQDY